MLPYICNIITYIFILFSLLAIIYKLNHGRIFNNQLYKIYYLIFILFGTFAFFGGDYIHYKDEIARLSTNYLTITHIETIYVILVKLTNGNYHLWRLVIYTTIFLLLNHFLKQTYQKHPNTILWYALFILPDAVNGRVPIGILSYFISAVYFIKGKRFLGFCFFIFAAISHKSILPILLLLPFIKVKLNYKLLPLIIVCIPILGIICKLFIIDKLIEIGVIRAASFENYSQVDNEIFSSIGGFFKFIFSVIPYNIVVIYFIFKLIKTKFHDIYLERLQSFTIIFTLYLIMCLFMFGYTNPMFYRYYSMLKYPMLILLPQVFPKVYQLRFTPKNFYFFIYFAFIQIYTVTLSAYYQYYG